MGVEKNDSNPKLSASTYPAPNMDYSDINALSQKQTTISLVSRKSEIIFSSICNADMYISWCLGCPKWKLVRSCEEVVRELKNMNYTKTKKSNENDMQINFLIVFHRLLTTKGEDSNKTIRHAYIMAKNSLSAEEYVKKDIVDKALIRLAIKLVSDTDRLWKLIEKLNKESVFKNIYTGSMVEEWESPLEDFISPNFFPGKTLLIGDAARPLYKSIVGLGGGVCSIACVDILANTFFHVFKETLTKIWTDPTLEINRSYELSLFDQFSKIYNRRSLNLTQLMSDTIHYEMQEYLYSNHGFVDRKFFNAVKRLIKKFSPKGYKEAAEIYKWY